MWEECHRKLRLLVPLFVIAYNKKEWNMGKMSQKRKSTDIFFRKYGNILGVSLTGTPKERLLKKINQYLAHKASFEAIIPLFITTPNPEQIVMAHKDMRLKRILQISDITLCDGVGLLAGYEFFLRAKNKSNLSNSSNLTNLPNFIRSLFSVLKKGCASDGLKIIKGREFFLDLMKLANRKKYRVFLLGSTKDVLEKTVAILQKKYPSVQIGYEWDIAVDNDGVPENRKEDKSEEEIIKNINKFQPHLLFVAFGAPKQEKWVYRNLKNLNTKLVMVVGGTFDYIAGKQNLPNRFFERLGLEWLWRLLTGTQKIGRIYNAVVKFPLMVIKNI